ncbi:MAG TPA: PASTA domain-containing protein, partial [Mycobacteriales bacterium]|nr:PASTA domain-containing protein [Mycobacteriales bacterium]
RFTTAAAFARAVTATQQHLDGQLAPALASANAVPTAVIPLNDMPVAPGAPLLAPASAPKTTSLGGRRPSRSAVLLTLGVALVLLLIAVAIAASRSGAGQRTVPAVAGQPLEQARATVEELGFDTTVTKETSRTVPSGTVVRTDPVGPTSVDSGSTIELVVSAGPAEVVLPSGLIGRPEAEVVARLSQLGLRPTVRRVTTSQAAAGTVFAISPNTGLRETAAVAVSVAVRPPPRPERGKDKKDEDDD